MFDIIKFHAWRHCKVIIAFRLIYNDVEFLRLPAICLKGFTDRIRNPFLPFRVTTAFN